MAKMKAKVCKPPQPVRLRQLLKAITTRRRHQHVGRMLQADYAVALDKVVRAIGRSQIKGGTVRVTSVRVF
jgi:hypothetical protein